MRTLDIKTPLKRSACFSDIHFGRKNNSEQHNNDCLEFVKFFCEMVTKDGTIDHICFLGDFFEQRNSLNIHTMNIAFEAMKLLNALGLPIFFIVGNHDLYLRNGRSIHSVIIGSELNNFHIIDQPTKVGDILILPYLFHEEYAEFYSEISNAKIIYGHLEFKGFVVTGDTNVLEHGPDHTKFNKPKKIFTGHFHKRQIQDNVVYIGNTFPMDFSDANDFERGMMIYDYALDEMKFFSWPDAPAYINTVLSQLLEDHKNILRKGATVKCLADDEITLEESNQIKETFYKKYNLRGITIEEPSTQDILENTDMDLEGLELETTDNIVETLLGRIDNEAKIKPDVLISLYKALKPKKGN